MLIVGPPIKKAKVEETVVEKAEAGDSSVALDLPDFCTVSCTDPFSKTDSEGDVKTPASVYDYNDISIIEEAEGVTTNPPAVDHTEVQVEDTQDKTKAMGDILADCAPIFGMFALSGV